MRHYGNFDNTCAFIIKNLKRYYNNIKSVYVTPYIIQSYANRLKDIANSELYDEIIYPGIENVPLKYAVCARNKYMIDSSDIVIAYVINNWGGAYRSLSYAKRKHKNIIYLPLKKQ